MKLISGVQVFSLDYSTPGKQLTKLGETVQAPERFAKLSWAHSSSEFPHLKYGMLGGGLSDGTVCVWNPAPMIEGAVGDVSKSSLLCRMNKHQGAVRGLEFNPFSPKLLASGAADGEVSIWDLGNPAQPSLYPAMKGAAAVGGQNQVTCLQWNRKVQHILATGTSSGSVVVWDLKKQRPVITLTDSNGRRRCSSIAWNPEIATQVMVASDDDTCPTIQLWDLRNAVSPVAELSHHSKGVLSLDWSPHDSSMLLSSGKDNRVVIWDVPSRQPQQEISSGANWQFQVQWSNSKQPGVFGGATFEGVVSLHSLSSCPPAVLSDGQISQVTKTKMPVWDKKPVAGASFGFGGKLLKISNNARQLPTGEIVTTASGEIDQVCMDGGMSKLSPEFESVIKSADRNSLKALCETRALSCRDAQEAETWKFLQTHFEEDSQREVLSKLGFDSVIAQEQHVEEVEQHLDALNIGDQHAETAFGHDTMQSATGFDESAAFFSESPTVSPDAFFDQLGSPNPPSARAAPVQAQAAPAVLPPSPKAPKVVDGTPGEAENEIQKALFVGNYALALETCLSVRRFSDALIIAAMMGSKEWEATRAKVMTEQPRPYMRIVNAVMDGDWQSFIESRSPRSWKETLATLLSSAPQEKCKDLVRDLSLNLLHAGSKHASLLCSICAGDVESAVTLWNEAAGPDAAPAMKEALLEKAVILGLGVDASGSSSALGDLLARQAEELASAGHLSAAYDLLCLVPGETSERANDLRDRLYQGGALDQQVAPQQEQPVQNNAQSQYTSQSWDSMRQDQTTYTQETYSAFPGTQGQEPPKEMFAPSAPPQQPQYGTYRQSPPASPYSTMSSSQPQAPPHVFTPAQPAQNAPPTSFSAPPPTEFQQPQQMPPVQQYVPSPGSASPNTYQQPHQVFQHSVTQASATSVPPMSYGAEQQPPVMQEQQESYAPSAPPQVFQPSSSASVGFEQPQQSFAATQPFQPTGQPSQPAPAPVPAKPVGPPTTIALMTADISKIPGNLIPVVNSFRSLYQSAEQFAATQPARKRELDDASKKLGGLVWKINEGQVSESVTSKLLKLAASLDAYDYPGAAHLQVQLTTSDWDECSSWLTALKRLIKIRQMSH